MWPFKKQIQLEQKSATTIPIPSGSWLEQIFGGGRVTASKAMKFYQETSSIAIAVDMIADAFEQIVPVLKTTDGEFIHDADVLSLLKNPNGFDSWRDFAGAVSRHYLLTHDSYISAVGSTERPPLELWAVKPQMVSTTQAEDTYPSSYHVTTGMTKGNYTRVTKRKRVRFFAGSMLELFHIKGFTSRSNELHGDSPLEAAALEAKQLIEGRNHNLSLLKNGSRLSLFVAFKDGEGTDDEQKARLQKLKEQLTGSENAGGVAIVNNFDIDKFQEMGMTNKDMDYAKLEESASYAVFMRYKIPLPLVTVKASTFNNLATGIELLYDQAVLPHTDKILANMSKFLLPRYGLDPAKVQITYNPESIEALKTRMLEELKLRKEINVETDNELRQLLPGREPYKGGDTHFKPATFVPVGEEIFTDDEDDIKEGDNE